MPQPTTRNKTRKRRSQRRRPHRSDETRAAMQTQRSRSTKHVRNPVTARTCRKCPRNRQSPARNRQLSAGKNKDPQQHRVVHRAAAAISVPASGGDHDERRTESGVCERTGRRLARKRQHRLPADRRDRRIRIQGGLPGKTDSGPNRMCSVRKFRRRNKSVVSRQSPVVGLADRTDDYRLIAFQFFTSTQPSSTPAPGRSTWDCATRWCPSPTRRALRGSAIHVRNPTG